MKYGSFVLIVVISLPIMSCLDSGDAGSQETRPNILFAIMDDATYMHMSAYGCQWVNTPNFDRVAKEGLLFNKAYTPNAKCAPSRSIIMTGRHSWQLEEAANHWPSFPHKFKVFTEALDENGYHVGSTGKGWSPGTALNEDSTRRNLMVNTYNELKKEAPTSMISPIDYYANFEAFLKDRDEKPFFFWYGGIEPHRAYEYGSGIKKGNKSLDQIDDSEIFGFWPVADSVKTDLLDYAYEIEYFDQQLGKMLQALEAADELDNTLIVVTADNGMPFPRVKGNTYEYANHLPLAMRWPEGIASPSREVDQLVSFLDFAPTFLEVAQVEVTESGMSSMTGQSLTDIFGAGQDSAAWRDALLLGKERHDIGRPNDAGYPIRAILKGDLLYIYNFENDRWPGGNPETGYLNTDGSPTKSMVLKGVTSRDEFKYWNASFGKRPSEELYDIVADPDCTINLANDPRQQERMAALKLEMIDRLTKQGDPRMAGAGAVFDQYRYADSRGVNFYQRYFSGEDVNHGWVNDSDFQSQEEVQRALDQFGRN